MDDALCPTVAVDPGSTSDTSSDVADKLTALTLNQKKKKKRNRRRKTKYQKWCEAAAKQNAELAAGHENKPDFILYDKEGKEIHRVKYDQEPIVRKWTVNINKTDLPHLNQTILRRTRFSVKK